MSEKAPPSFERQDLDLLALFDAQSTSLRLGLATLARIGVRWRREQPDRCVGWIAMLETHPFYKAGQTLFDLFEFEDFMLDETHSTSAEALGELLGRIARILGLPAIQFRLPDDLPDLEMGFYLYRDTVLGLIAVLRGQDGLSGFDIAFNN